MGGKHGKEVRAGRQTGEKSVEERKCRIGVRPGGEDIQDRRNQLRQPLARLLAAHGAVAAFVPGAQRLERAFGVRVALGCESLQRGIAIALAAEIECVRCRERRIVVEERRVVALHRSQVAQERLGEGLGRLEPEEGRDLRDPLVVLRHAVGLPVIRHLQAVLDGAVESVSLHQLRHRLTAHMAGFDQAVECLVRAAHAERRIPPAPNKLLGSVRGIRFRECRHARA